MAPLSVVRIEHPRTQKGPFTHSFLSLDAGRMPTGKQDGFEELPFPETRFAFHSKQQMRLWVTARDLDKMRVVNHQLVEFMCPPGTFRIGENQVVFDNDAAICTAREVL